MLRGKYKVPSNELRQGRDAADKIANNEDDSLWLGAGADRVPNHEDDSLWPTALMELSMPTAWVVEADHSLGGLSDEPVDPGPHLPCNLVMDY